LLDAEYGISQTGRPFIPKAAKAKKPVWMEEEAPKNSGNPLKLYDCFKVACVKDHHVTYAAKRQEAVIEDLTAQNAEYLARAEAAETEMISVKKFLKLFSWQSKGETFEGTVNNLR
jgi:hypothetical protein